MAQYLQPRSANGGSCMKTLASICRVAFLTLAISQLLSNCMTEDGQVDFRSANNRTTNQPVAAAPPATGSTLASADPMGNPGQPAGVVSASGNLEEAGYRIAPRDILQVAVFQIQDLNNTVQVNEDGTIALQLVGKIPVAGLTTYEAERLIAAHLRKFVQSPQVTVSMKQYGKKITISGEVKQPRVLADDGALTLTQAIADAGGLSELGNSSRLHVARSSNGHVQDDVYDLDDIQAGKVRDPLLRGGDIVVVESATTKVALKTVSSLLPFAVLAALW
jgi:polysaccharide biosynthesis/export protein